MSVAVGIVLNHGPVIMGLFGRSKVDLDIIGERHARRNYSNVVIGVILMREHRGYQRRGCAHGPNPI